MSWTSPPEQNARPAPVITTTRTSFSCVSSECIGEFSIHFEGERIQTFGPIQRDSSNAFCRIFVKENWWALHAGLLNCRASPLRAPLSTLLTGGQRNRGAPAEGRPGKSQRRDAFDFDLRFVIKQALHLHQHHCRRVFPEPPTITLRQPHESLHILLLFGNVDDKPNYLFGLSARPARLLRLHLPEHDQTARQSPR